MALSQSSALYPPLELKKTDSKEEAFDVHKVLEKEHLGKLKVPVVVTLDVSESMASTDPRGHRLFGEMNYEQLKNAYASGQYDQLQAVCSQSKMQKLLERCFKLASRFDDDGVLDVYLFGHGCLGPFRIDKTNIETALYDVLSNIDFVLHYETDYLAFLNTLKEQYFSTPGDIEKAQANPPFVIVPTDGDANIWDEDTGRRVETAKVHEMVKASFAELSGLPIFFKFLGIGQSDCVLLDNLDNEKKLEQERGIKRFILDNIDFVKIQDPAKLRFDELLREYRPWLNEAHNKGIITLDAETLQLLKRYPIKSEGRGVDEKVVARVSAPASSASSSMFYLPTPSAPPPPFNPAALSGVDPDMPALEAKQSVPAKTEKVKKPGLLSKLFGSKPEEEAQNNKKAKSSFGLSLS